MNATEARKKAQEINSVRDNSIYDAIKAEIIESVDAGLFVTTTYIEFSEVVHNKLEKEGFDIELFDDQRDGYCAIIKW